MALRFEEVQKLVRETTFQHFPGGEIKEVRVFRDKDFDGEPILRVQAIFDARAPLDPKLTSSLIWRLRESLETVEEHDFPSVSFVSKSDARSLRPEAA